MVLKRTFNSIHKSIDNTAFPAKAIRGIGVAHSWIVDSAAGIVLSFPRPGQMNEWKDVRLCHTLEQEFRVPCILEDSVRAIALAEQCFGIGSDLDDFIYIDVGMGIGAGIILNSRLYKGPRGGAGEFGHMTVEENTELTLLPIPRSSFRSAAPRSRSASVWALAIVETPPRHSAFPTRGCSLADNTAITS